LGSWHELIPWLIDAFSPFGGTGIKIVIIKIEIRREKQIKTRTRLTDCGYP
jgi:hypothetical protein